MQNTMKIGALSQATGVNIEAVRYYEKCGLLQAPARAANGYRAYRREHLERLAFIRQCRSLDMPLAAIKRLLALADASMEHQHGIEALLDEQLQRVRARMQSLKALERQLGALRAHCDADHHSHPCGILKELVAAAKSEAKLASARAA